MNPIQAHADGEYGSEFEYDSEADRARSRREDLATKPKAAKHKLASKAEVTEEYNKEEGRKMRYHILSLDAYSRHKKFINDYLQYFGGTRDEMKRDTSRDKTDIDVIHENHRFLWSENDAPNESWEKRMAKKYHDKLFKEYCITDLSRYRENKIAMRWRVEKEVVLGKGQFICGDKRCPETEGLRTWEVNFGYVEHEEKKNALVKLRLCSECSYKLNYHKQRREVTKRKHRHTDEEKKTKKHKKQDADDGGDGVSGNTKASSDQDKETEDNKDDESESSSDASASKDVWQGPAKIVEEKSREAEFDEYFEDMFM